MIISDTLHYRPDGTVSGVTRVTREVFETPSGRPMTEDISTVVGIEVVTALLDRGYAAFDAHNKALETQIEEERSAASADKASALKTVSDAYQAERQTLVEAHEAAIAAMVKTHADEIASERAKTHAALEAVQRLEREEPVTQ